MKQYQTQLGQLLLGDSLQILSTLEKDSIDAIITDPPYSSGGLHMNARQKKPESKYLITPTGKPTFSGDNKDQRSFFFWSYFWLSECFELLKDKGYLLVFADWRQLPLMTDIVQSAGYTWRGVIPWDKGRGSRPPNKSYFRHQCEYIIWATKGGTHGCEGHGPWDGCFQYPIKQKDKHHITGKPTPLLEKLVQVAPAGGRVLDPFAGSATTAVACEKQGRQWIAIENGQENFAIGVERLERLKNGLL